MRVLIVGLNFHPELTGIGKYTGQMAAYLAGQGNEVHAVTTPPYYPDWRVRDGYIKSFISSVSSSCTPEACIPWMQDALEKVSSKDQYSGPEAVFVVSTRENPRFSKWERS